MARRSGRTTQFAAAFVTAAVVAAIGTPAIATASATSTPVLTETGSPTPGGGSPMGSYTAATRATKAYAAYDEAAVDPEETVPLVTVETSPTGPKVIAHDVDSAQEARAVATDAAQGNDLVAVTTDKPVAPSAPATNDPGLGYQWGLSPAKTSFVEAWKTTKGGGVTVAVIDTGVAAKHPDLIGRVLAGHEFLNGGAIDRDVSPMIDDCGHGTHVAGTIAAIANNSTGGAGAAPNVKILPVRVMAATGMCGGWSSDVARGITWAANNGAKVINLSVGGPGPDQALATAVKYARSKGAVVVAAAGNNNGSCTPYQNKTAYPGATTGAIGVAAVDSNMQRGCFSNTGSYVDLSGPGVSIYSTVGTVASGSAVYTYQSWSGTSMASPHVAAAAALVLAYRPICTPDQVETRLEATAKRLPVGTAGDPRLYGAGLVDPARAISVLKTIPGKC